MAKNFLERLFGAVKHSSESAALEDYRTYVTDLAEVGSGGTVRAVDSAPRAAVVVAELIRRANRSVIIYGDYLADNIFLSPQVVDAVREFYATRVEGRVVVVTNRTGFRELLAKRSEVAVARIDSYTIPSDVKARYFFKGVVLTDESDNPSYWFVSGRREHPHGTFEFRSPTAGGRLRTSLGYILAKVGSPAHAE